MLDKKLYETALIKGENIKVPENYNYKDFYTIQYTEKEIIESTQTDYKIYKNNFKQCYEVWLLDGYVIGHDKEERKNWLLDKIKIFTNNLNSDNSNINKVELMALIELYNKYFTIIQESFTANYNNKNVYCEWLKNEIMKLHTKEETYTEYKIYIETEDFYNHKINGEYTEYKYSIQYPQMFLIFTPTKNIIIN